MKTKCAKCGGSMKKGGTVKKMAKGGQSLAALTMPGYNANITTMKKGGSAKNFAALAPPYDKATFADKIAGATKKAKFGSSVPVQHSPAPGRVRSSSGTGTVPVGMRMKEGGEAKPSAGLSKKTKSKVAKKASAGKDIGKKGKNFAKVAAAAGGGEKGKKIAAAAMWKNIKRG